jgi:hypothetical protein
MEAGPFAVESGAPAVIRKLELKPAPEKAETPAL